MASYINKDIVCKCCGKKYTARLLRGMSRTAPVGLDTNPYEPAVFDRITMCPYCGYASENIGKQVDGKVRAAIYSKEYQELFQNPAMDGTQKKLLLSAYLNVCKGAMYEAGYHYLMAYWYEKGSGQNAGKELEKAVQCFSEYLEDHEDVEAAILLTDCMRQASRFDEAAQTARSLVPYIKKERHLKIICFELSLIEEQDASAHLQREAVV